MQNIIIKIAWKLKDIEKKSWAIYNKTKQNKIDGDEDWIGQKESEERPK